jgi:nitroreductase
MEDSADYIFKRPITQVIEERISIRTYKSKPLEEKLKADLATYLESLEGPFKSKARYKLVDIKVSEENNIKLGTYGIIKGVSSFIVSATKSEEMALEELGYELEKFILYASSLGLGCCWLGGTFKKGQFAKAIELKAEEILPIITPIGYPDTKKNILASIIRSVAGSKNRKTWQELFFDGNFDKSLVEDQAGVYRAALEMVRLAPSASNKQPWRIVKNQDRFDFYLCHNKGYAKALGFDMQKIDMGIAMCHFDLTLKEAGIKGSFEKCKQGVENHESLMEYIISWRR